MSGFFTGELWGVRNGRYCRNQTAFYVDNEIVTSMTISFDLSLPSIRTHLKTIEEPVYQRQNQSYPKLGSFHERLEAWLEQEAHLPHKQRRTAQRLYECIQVEGYHGSIQAYCAL
ncbi:hypothetical protein B0F87_11334 [Methylobacter tundripaludum]|uniref:Transposase n=1 Tax=Methylobacter tundripaludum TaxID=173365 RepID=A0A2S6H944_9GAMM|nr:hypothetical protein B0F87_11334 [Methylobacter tundripaludum]